MVLQTPEWLNYLVAYLTAVALIYGGFNASERLLRPETLAHIGQRVGGVNGREKILGREWTAGFLEFFDTLFIPAAKLSSDFPLPGFGRSAAFSFAFVIGLASLFYAIRLGVVFAPVSLIFLFVFINLSVDYLSIIKTRFVLYSIRETRFPYIWLALDVVLTFFLPLLIFVAAKTVLGLAIVVESGNIVYEEEKIARVDKDGTVTWYQYIIADSIEIPTDVSSYTNMVIWGAASVKQIKMAVALDGSNYEITEDIIPTKEISYLTHGLNVFVYSTFLTFLWVCFYAIGDILVRGARRVNAFRGFLERHTLLERHSLSIMGYSLIVVVTICFWSYVGVSYLLVSQK